MLQCDVLHTRWISVLPTNRIPRENHLKTRADNGVSWVCLEKFGLTHKQDLLYDIPVYQPSAIRPNLSRSSS